MSTAFQLQHPAEVVQVVVQAAAVLLLCYWLEGPLSVSVADSIEAAPCGHSRALHQLGAGPLLVVLWTAADGLFLGRVCCLCGVLRRGVGQTPHSGGEGSRQIHKHL